MLPLFKAATKSALAILGESALLRGEPCKVNVEHGVQLTGLSDYDPTVVTERDVAHIDADMNPRVGDLLEHPDGDYKLDRLLEDKGAFRRFVLVKA